MIQEILIAHREVLVAQQQASPCGRRRAGSLEDPRDRSRPLRRSCRRSRPARATVAACAARGRGGRPEDRARARRAAPANENDPSPAAESRRLHRSARSASRPASRRPPACVRPPAPARDSATGASRSRPSPNPPCAAWRGGRPAAADKCCGPCRPRRRLQSRAAKRAARPGSESRKHRPRRRVHSLRNADRESGTVPADAMRTAKSPARRSAPPPPRRSSGAGSLSALRIRDARRAGAAELRWRHALLLKRVRISAAACDTLPAPSVTMASPGPAAAITAAMPCSTDPA